VFGLSSPGPSGPEAILHPTGIQGNVTARETNDKRGVSPDLDRNPDLLCATGVKIRVKIRIRIKIKIKNIP